MWAGHTVLVSSRRKLSISRLCYSNYLCCTVNVIIPQIIQLTMPERLEQVEVAPSVPEKSQPEGSPDVEKVSWPVEDPSEYRPELAPGGDLENLGKDVEDFRVYYAVRRQTINLTGVFHRASTYDRFFPRI